MRWSATLFAPDGDFTRASVGATIDASSIDTGVADRDAHLKSPDFLDVAQYPEIRFTTSRVETKGNHLRLAGSLTVKGVTRDIVLDVERLGCVKDPWGNERAAFSAKTTIDRRDFGLTWNQVLETGGVMVGEHLTVEIEIEAVRQAATKVA